MKDLDFDELDRAVNSLMAGVPKQAAPGDQPAEKTLTISDTPQANASPSKPVGLPQAPTPPPVAAPVSPPSSAPASRRSGRFMDVVHPSSDMKKSETPLEKSVSRLGTTIEPKSDMPKPSAVAAVPLEVPSSAPPAPKPESSPVVSEPTSSNSHADWPDPLEMAGFSDKPGKETTEKRESSEAPSALLSPKAEPEAPLTSPFLADTKVDKRPLGANAINQPTTAEEKVDIPSSEEADDQLPAAPNDTKPTLPAELHNDLMAIESDTTEPLSPERETSLKPEAEATPAPSIASEREDDAVGSKPAVPEEKKEEKPATIPTGPVSIPQQYKEEPSSEEPKSGAIYDTDTYHKPLDHPAKQKSGWMWVIWILLILIIGAGAGAALYFLGIVR